VLAFPCGKGMGECDLDVMNEVSQWDLGHFTDTDIEQTQVCLTQRAVTLRQQCAPQSVADWSFFGFGGWNSGPHMLSKEND
jgi:hypothetical protein